MARTAGTKMLGVEVTAALVDEFKAFCSGRGQTVRHHIEAAMRRYLDDPPPVPPVPDVPPLPPPTVGGQRPARKPPARKKK